MHRFKFRPPSKQSIDRGRINVASRLVSALTFIWVLAGVSGVHGQNPPAATCGATTPGYCPGATNPVGKPKNAIVFPVSGLMTFAPGASGSNETAMLTYVGNANGTQIDIDPDHSSAIPGAFSPSTTYAAAAGRIIAPGSQTSGKFGYPEDVVYAWRNGNVIQVDFANPAHSKYGGVQLSPQSWDGTQIAPRLDLSTYGASSDFVAIAVGDVDGAIDANGESHDEVVVAFPVVDSAGTWKIEIYVLNYTNATSASDVVITENNTIHAACGTTCFATSTSFAGATQNQGTILSSGNNLSIAIGDFDGDGTNEIAVAHVGNGEDIYLTMFRYRDIWSTGSRLQWISDYDQKASLIDTANPKSNVGSVSLISGDFNNDGKDELALGYALWEKNSTHQTGKSGENYDCMATIDDFATPFLGKATCDYEGYAVQYTNYVSIYRSGFSQANPTGVTPGATTRFSLPNATNLLTNQVFMSGGTGDWAAINGSWTINAANAVDSQGFSIPVDSSAFSGTPTLTAIWISTTAPLTPGSTAAISPRADNPGGKNLPDIVDFRDFNSRPVMQLVGGLFDFDPTGPNFNPASFQQRQIVAAWNTPSPCDFETLSKKATNENQYGTPLPYWPYDLDVAFLTVSTDGADVPAVGDLTSLAELSYGHDDIGNKYGYPHQRITLTASNVFGASDNADPSNPKPPVWQFGLGAWLDSNTSSMGAGTGYHLRLGSIVNGKFGINQDVFIPNGISNGYEGAGTLPVVAYDPDGSSTYLGGPIHLQVSNFQTPAFIMQEPPKQMMWIPASGSNPGFIKNVNRNSNTYTSVSTDTSNTSGTAQTGTSGQDYAASSSVSAGFTLQGGNPEIISTKFSLQDTLSFKYEHDRSESKLNSQTVTVQMKAEDMAKNDDYLQYTSTDYDVWRYRVYGMGPVTDDQGNTDTSNPYKYYELVVPGSPQKHSTGGVSQDWYRPMHENGNVLSYPPPSQTGIPVDTSPTPYKVNGQTPSGLTNGIMWNQYSYCYGTASGPNALTITGVRNTSDTVTDNNTFQEDNDLKLGYKSTLAGSYSQNASFDLNLGAKQSFGQSSVTSNDTSASTGFTFNLGAGDANWAYNIAPTLYNSLSGSIKMSYTVQLSTGNSQSCVGENWTNYNVADPGLLLPHRFVYVGSNSSGDIFGLTPVHNREEVKSLLLQNPTPNPIESTNNNPVYDLLASAPAAGNPVQLSIPVYNYSVGTAANNVTVTFSAIPVSDPNLDPGGSGNNEYGCGTPAASGWVCPDSYRKQLKNMDGSNVTASVNVPAWSSDADTPNYKMATATWTIPPSMANTKYRIYVNLIYSGTETNPPQQACTKIPCPPLCDESVDVCSVPTDNTDPSAPGQNNEGYEDIWIGSADSVGSSRERADVRTTDDSLVAVNKHRTWNRVAFGFKGREITLRVKAISDAVEQRHHRAIVTDMNLTAPPRDRIAGRQVIAGKILQGATPNGSSAFFTWVPQTIGVHRLRVEVEEFADDTRRGNNKANLLEVIFRAPGDVDGNGHIDSNDLYFLERDNGKRVEASACGYACDLNGDGWITREDQELLVGRCTDEHCAIGGKNSAPVSVEQVRKLNRKEIEGLRTLPVADWRTFFYEARDRELPLIQSLYMRSILRAAAGGDLGWNRLPLSE